MADRVGQSSVAESFLQKQLILGELLDLPSFTNVCKTFVDLYKVGLKVFDATGPLKDKEVDYAAERKGKPTVYVFIQADKWDRPPRSCPTPWPRSWLSMVRSFAWPPM